MTTKKHSGGRPRKGTHVVAHRKQAEGTKTCGQDCLLMLEPSIAPRSGPLHGPAIIKALKGRGWDPSKKLEPRRVPLADLCVVKIKWNGQATGHWVIKDGEVLHDPGERTGMAWKEGWVERAGGRITGHIRLNPPKRSHRGS